MTLNELREAYLRFFEAQKHVRIPVVPLVPENDATTLFTSSGMQPLLPYFLGELHPQGTRVVNSQPCFRAGDIMEVGDNRHTTFFEMLGNWSFGDYFKAEQLRWFWTFLTGTLGLSPDRLYVSVFSGDPALNIPKDAEAISVWQTLFKEKGIAASVVDLVTESQGAQKGMQGGRIFTYDAQKNWWSRDGVPANMPSGEPGGPDSEVFYEFTQVEHDPRFGAHCHPNCDCGRFMEIGNSVFMQYLKNPDGAFSLLPKQNVDFGGGLERILAAVQATPDVFETDAFSRVIQSIEQVTGVSYKAENKMAMRVVADHMRAATFMIVQGVQPSNKQQGYVLRRLLRRAAVQLRTLGADIAQVSFEKFCEAVIETYGDVYFDPAQARASIQTVVGPEMRQFVKSLDRGLKEIEKQPLDQIDGVFAFDLFQTYGFPFEITQEIVAKRGGTVDKAEFDAAFNSHQQKSRTASVGMFKGGLVDPNNAQVLQYHTLTHLTHQALRDVLGDSVAQKGSNITPERMRFDFSYELPLTPQQIAAVEQIVNDKIQANLPVSFTEMRLDEALAQGALAFFGEKYGERVKVYTIGDYSKEVCGGPHVSSTGEIKGTFKIVKEQSVGKGVRRIKAVLE